MISTLPVMLAAMLVTKDVDSEAMMSDENDLSDQIPADHQHQHHFIFSSGPVGPFFPTWLLLGNCCASYGTCSTNPPQAKSRTERRNLDPDPACRAVFASATCP